MKKLTYLLIAVSLVMGGAVYAENSHDGREKISSPSEMRNFRDIVKHGQDLFGIRIAAILEKIPSPEQVRNFENIRRIGPALWGYRKISGSAMVTAENRACVTAAIAKKDNAVQRGLNDFASKTNVSIKARTDCQVAAISLGSAQEQQAANLRCVMTYQTSTKANLKALADIRDSAWRTYKAELKACASANAEVRLEDGGNLESMF